MSNTIDTEVLVDLIHSIFQFGERFVVQRQLTAFALTMLGAWLLAQALWWVVGQRVENWVNNRLSGKLQRHLQYDVSVIHQITLPILGITGLGVAQQLFDARNWQSGLFSKFSVLLWAILAYRLFIGLLEARLGKCAMRRYHHRFIAPLFYMSVSSWFLNNLAPLSRLANIKIWDGFTDPITLGSLLFATVGFYFWYDGSGVVKDLLHFLIAPYTSADPGTVEASLTIGRYVIISIGLLIVLAILGFDSTMLAFATGGLSVGIGFGSKEIIGNLISGILLLFDQSLRPGDIVSVEGQMGVVNNVGIRAITVNTLNNVEVVIPNQTFLTSSVTTYTKSDRLVRILIPFDVANAYSPHAVRAAALLVAQRHPLVADEPAPDVFFFGNGDTSFLYELAVWCDDPMRTKPLTSELHYAMFDEFKQRGLEPPTPQRDLQILNRPLALSGTGGMAGQPTTHNKVEPVNGNGHRHVAQ